ncbi:linear amide C-N hydrolase [Castellaniella sp.]|uniref:linear amide C-N hydrolase n=1 Tax=Castellaniella sp. TaxID=1955812 RepID=UPI002AFEA19E|nr:linear amide C-N hydrolase [Castellaniella sp.]
MCTSLLYRDANDCAYLGRTLELSLDLPYLVARFPLGAEIQSVVQGHPGQKWAMQHAVIAVTMPAMPPVPGVSFSPSDLKIIEGVNDAGLSCSVQSYPQAGGPQAALDVARPAISAADIGAFVLGCFSTVAQVKAALEDTQIELSPIPILGGLQMPFHYAVHDATGASLVIEFHHGALTVYDNPVGVMTNAPQFSWHLTNLNNYTFLSNIDRSRGRFSEYDVVQPGSGIAKVGLPGTDTSVDRFVRAAYYAQFAEKQTDPDQAVQMVAHIMNNFDRPRGITVDPPEQGSSHLQVAGHALKTIPTEFTSWTSLTDLSRRRLYLRGGAGMNYVCLDLIASAPTDRFSVIPMSQLVPSMPLMAVLG